MHYPKKQLGFSLARNQHFLSIFMTRGRRSNRISRSVKLEQLGYTMHHANKFGGDTP